MGGGAEGTEADRHIRLILLAAKNPVRSAIKLVECAKLKLLLQLRIVLAICTPVVLLYRRKSRSISPRRRKSRSPITRRHKSRSPTPKRYKRLRSRSSSLSPVHKSSSPSLGSIERKNASEKLKKEEEERKRYIKYYLLFADYFCFSFHGSFRYLDFYQVYLIFATFSKYIERQQEAELKLIEEETAKRVEEAIQKKVEERLNSEEIKQEIQKRLEEGRRRLNDEVAAQLEKEKEAAILEARQKEEVARKENEELEKMLEENRKRVEETQIREAMEQQRREEERYRELEELQRQKEEAMKRKKQQEEEERLNQMKLLGKNKLRPKLSFALGSK
ncbi:hypothetical protein Goklo_007834 [Gossypium klotzschianum]|uniref:Arginine and glutamate-rich protein 1 n=2 Tax=Gossypium TaxID=3633 RepID=A0A7J8UYP3_9ROSI|nr:hypothetical protein [Gossypium klotzschianum]